MSSIDETTDHKDHEPTTQNSLRRHRRQRQPDVLSTISEEFDAEEEERLVKKLDLFILPIMAIVYFFQCTYCIMFFLVLLTNIEQMSIKTPSATRPYLAS